MRLQTESEQTLLQRDIRCQRRHLAAMDDLAVIHHQNRGATILLVEQNFHAARELGDKVLVMDNGKIVHRGEMAALASDVALQERLLGLSLEAHQ